MAWVKIGNVKKETSKEDKTRERFIREMGRVIHDDMWKRGKPCANMVIWKAQGGTALWVSAWYQTNNTLVITASFPSVDGKNESHDHFPASDMNAFKIALQSWLSASPETAKFRLENALKVKQEAVKCPLARAVLDMAGKCPCKATP